VLAISAVPRRTAVRYGSRAERYIAIEVGHAAQNVCLQAVALELGTVIVGAFDDAGVAGLLGLAAEERPYALLPVGRR
jgi:SagB-type dehydrogenase family enzyme